MVNSVEFFKNNGSLLLVTVHEGKDIVSIHNTDKGVSLELSRSQAEGLLLELLSSLQIICKITASGQPYLVVEK